MAIPDEKIEEVRAAADLVDLASEYTRLKQSGSRYKGLCPFHEENTPSFTVDPEENLYYCFGCQAGGDVFKFMQEMEGLSFLEGVRMLADRAGIELPEADGDPESASEREAITHALRFAANFYFRQLTQSETGREALTYLKQRGFKKETIKHFGLGYAPDRWDALLKAAEEEHIEADVLEAAGLVKARKGGDGHYDRFRGRIMFPILSHVGKVLGFGGRILHADDDQPKYINTPETEVYNKRRVLYGLHQARKAIRDKEEATLVEGYTDVIALHQVGVENVVASSGTALTTEQIKLLDRYAQRIVLLYDADEAGIRAALRSIDLILEQGLAPYVVALPGGEDPDSFVFDRGEEAFREYVAEHRRDFTDFKYEQARREGKLDTPEDKAQAMRSVLESVARLPDALMRETYLHRASEVMGMPDIQLHEELRQIRQQKEQKQRRRARRASDASAEDERGEEASTEGKQETDASPEPLPPEKMLHRLMLERGAPLVEYILGHMAMDEFSEGPSRRMAQAFLEMYEEGAVDRQRLLDGRLGDDLQRLASEVLVDEFEASSGWQEHDIAVPKINEAPYESAASAMTQLKLRRVDRARQELNERLYRAEQEGEELRPLQEEKMELEALRKHIQERAFLEQDRT